MFHHGFHDFDDDYDDSMADEGAALKFRQCPCGGDYKRTIMLEEEHWYNAGSRQLVMRLRCQKCGDIRYMGEDAILRE